MATNRVRFKTNDENVHRTLKVKKQAQVKKRTAFRELGNKHKCVQQKQEHYIVPKKNTGKLNNTEILKPITRTKKKPLEKQETIDNLVLCKPDPDENIKNEPQMVPEYLQDIFKYLRKVEAEYVIRKNFLQGHSCTSTMRKILVNWLVEVHSCFKLVPETLHICVAIIDRYLQDNKKIGRNILQLVGVSSLFIASKYEDLYPPELEDLVDICDNTFSKKQILDTEKEILKTLDFSLGKPTSIIFLRRYNKIAQVKLECHELAKYILELSLLESHLSHISPSFQAAAASCLAMGITSNTMNLQTLWSPILTYYTTYKYSDFNSIIVDFASLLLKSEKSKYQSVKKKFASTKFVKISLNSIVHGPVVKKLSCEIKK